MGPHHEGLGPPCWPEAGQVSPAKEPEAGKS
jgi:hypothetical protein